MSFRTVGAGRRPWRGALLGLTLAGTLAGCGSMLPRAELATQTPWGSFDEALKNFERIEPHRTTVAELKALGVDPYSRPNIAILNYADLVRRFVPPGSDGLKALDPGVRECLEALQACKAYEVTLKDIHRDRSGNFLKDFLNFERITEVNGWQFTGTLVIKGDLVVHKVWSGQPAIHEHEVSRNPLGPFQGWGETNPIRY
jgi:hypothetical protein